MIGPARDPMGIGLTRLTPKTDRIRCDIWVETIQTLHHHKMTRSRGGMGGTMRRRNKAFAASLFELLEDRLTLSHLGVHPAAGIGHQHAAVIGRHHAAVTGHHHAAITGHHHAARLRHHHHHTGTVPPVTGSGSTGTTPGSGSTTTGPGPTSGGSGPTAQSVVLSGTVEGRTPLVGSGTIGPLGAVSSTGTLTGRDAEPVIYSGSITLVGATGSITASLSGLHGGPDYPGETIDLTYTITGGTGAFQDATGSGQADFTGATSSTGDTFVLTFGNATTTSA